MIRRFIEWLLHKLHLKKRVEVDPLKALEEIIPTVFTTMLVISMFKWLKVIMPKFPWYVMVLLKIRFFIQRARAIVIGY